MGKKERAPEIKVDPQGWMLTFSDLVTLLLTFFVMLLTMSSMDNKKFADVFTVFSDKVGVLEFSSFTQMQNTARFMAAVQEKMPGSKLLAQQIIDQTKAVDTILNLNPDERQGWLKTLGDNIKVTRTKEGLVITLANQILFRPATAILTERSKALLSRVAQFLSIIKKPISIVGHTDSSPVKSPIYPSNWELSLARAVVVMEQILKNKALRRDRFRVGGRGDVEPLATNATTAGRAKNRRVDIIVDLRGL